jgi:hypothetical protein
MVWFVRPMQLKGDNGKPSGKWHLVAHSDEGGGFHTCSAQDFDSAEAAQADPIGRAKAMAITGIDDDFITRPVPNLPATDLALAKCHEQIATPWNPARWLRWLWATIREMADPRIMD